MQHHASLWVSFLAPSLYSVLNVLFPISSFCPAQDEPGFFICRGGLMLAPAPECLPLERKAERRSFWAASFHVFTAESRSKVDAKNKETHLQLFTVAS